VATTGSADETSSKNKYRKVGVFFGVQDMSLCHHATPHFAPQIDHISTTPGSIFSQIPLQKQSIAMPDKNLLFIRQER
jgi:hypothetical protein